MHFSEKDIPKTKKMLKNKFEKIKSTHIPLLKKSWKCTSFCHQGKSTFEGTSIHPIMENRHGQRTSYGSYMTQCEQVKYEIERKGIKLSLKNANEADLNIIVLEPKSIDFQSFLGALSKDKNIIVMEDFTMNSPSTKKSC